MAYVKILQSELDELVLLKNEYHANCISLYNNIMDRDKIIAAIKIKCDTAMAEKQRIVDNMTETIIDSSDVIGKRTTVYALLSKVTDSNSSDIYLDMKESFL